MKRYLSAEQELFALPGTPCFSKVRVSNEVFVSIVKAILEKVGLDVL